GELASHLAWKKDEITLSQARFALEHVAGQGQAVVTLARPRPHIRAALALDHLDLNPFLPNSARQKVGGPLQSKGAAPPSAGDDAQSSRGEASDADQNAGTAEPAPEAAPPSETDAQRPAPQADDNPAVPPQNAAIPAAPEPAAHPAQFDADVNV